MSRLFVLSVALSFSALAADSPAVVLLQKRCVGCHSGKTKQSGLDLTRRDLALRGGDRGPAITPGNAKESLLYQVLTHNAKPNMPLQAHAHQTPSRSLHIPRVPHRRGSM